MALRRRRSTASATRCGSRAGMTYKAAAAGLDLGGGKGVICAPAERLRRASDRRALLLDFGDLVESLDGRYITAEDVGIAPDDMVVIARADRPRHRAAARPRRLGRSEPVHRARRRGRDARLRQGALRLGRTSPAARSWSPASATSARALARRLADAGAELAVSDIDPAKRELGTRARRRHGSSPEDAMPTECDVLAPCALGGAIDAANLPRLRCEIVCGCANNQLADEGLADGSGRAGHPLRARLHRQRRRPDPRLQARSAATRSDEARSSRSGSRAI